MVSFNQTKGQMSSLENTLKSVQVTLEKTQFALEVKQGKGLPSPTDKQECVLNSPEISHHSMIDDSSQFQAEMA